MAISAYVGVPGSGKTYEVVKNVVVNGFVNGRRIVTNIEGLNADNLKEYCQKVLKVDASSLGKLIQVSDQQCAKDAFFPYKGANDSFCQPGDLIIIDEVWRIWESDQKIPASHRSFIAEHRHFVNEQGITCDLIVINQSVSNLPRFLKDRIETTYRMTKHVALGFRNRYRVDVYTGAKTFKSNLTTRYQEKYNPAIFKLYKSYDGAGGKESVTDSRQSLFSSRKIIVFVLALILVFLFGAYKAYSFFNVSTPVQSTTPNLSTFNEVATSATSSENTPFTHDQLSNNWKISGTLFKGDQHFYVLEDSAGQLRLEPASRFTFEGRMAFGVIDGEKVTFYSGRGK